MSCHPKELCFLPGDWGERATKAFPWDLGPWALAHEAAGLQVLALHYGCFMFCCWMSCKSWLCDCRAGFLPSLPARTAPLQGCHWVGTSVQLSKPIVHGRSKACISDEEARKVSGQGSDPAHICSKTPCVMVIYLVGFIHPEYWKYTCGLSFIRDQNAW